MNNRSKSKNFFWPAVMIVLVVFILFAAILFLFLLPDQTTFSTDTMDQALSPDEKQTQAALYNPTPPADAVFKPADKLIIKTVDFDKSGNIIEISMFVPANMAGGFVIVDGQQAEVTRTQNNKTYSLNFSIPSTNPKKTLSFYVELGGKRMAECSVSNTDTLIVSGDCVF